MKAIRVRHSVIWSVKERFGWFSMKLRMNMAGEIMSEGEKVGD